MGEIQIEIPTTIENLQLPDPGLVNYWRFENKRIFYIQNEIDEDILELQKSILYYNIEDMGIPKEKRKPIVLLINSPGGLLDETLSLCTTIKESRTPIITINIGVAASAAGLILMAGHTRYCYPYSYVIIHSGSGGFSGTYEQTQEQTKAYKKQIDSMSEYILERTHMDEKVYRKNKSKEWYLFADEQVKNGVVHSIIKDLNEVFDDKV